MRFRDHVDLPYEDKLEDVIRKRGIAPVDQLLRDFPGITFRRLYPDLDPDRLQAALHRAVELEPSYEPPRFFAYFAISVPADVQPEEVAARVRRWDSVKTAYVEGGPVPPPFVNVSDDPYYYRQGYLDPAPDGIDAHFAWKFPGGDGAGLVQLVDLETGWNLDHEDLAAHNVELISGLSAPLRANHGTAVLGVVSALDNSVGCVGIAPNVASLRVVSRQRVFDVYDTADAIMSALLDPNALRFGDVLLLEAQTRVPGYPGSSGGTPPDEAYLPVEVEEAVFEAIRLATTLGIIVIEAAGNGYNDLDRFYESRVATVEYWLRHLQEMLQTASPSQKPAIIAEIQETGAELAELKESLKHDSGAILVGAATATTPHGRRDFSNHGDRTPRGRVHCYAWGEWVTTCDATSQQAITDLYQIDFGGTSSASAIIAGAALVVQSISEANLGFRWSPKDLRRILSDPTTGTASEDPSWDRIGVMPNLRQIIEDVLGLAPRPDIRDFGAEIFEDAGILATRGSGSGPTSTSPDLIVRPTRVHDPQRAFGEGSGTENSNTLSAELVPGKDNFVYVRVRNRGGFPASGVEATVFCAPLATVLTPDLWTRLGSISIRDVPGGNVLTVSDAIRWPAAHIPGSGHYSLIALIGHDATPIPDLACCRDWDDFRHLSRQPNYAARSFNLVTVPSAESAERIDQLELPFLFTGPPDQARWMALEVVGKLPSGTPVVLEMPMHLIDALGERSPLLGFDRERQVGGVRMIPHGRRRLGEALFSARSRTPMSLRVNITKKLRENPHEIFVRHLSHDEEVGRVTWRLMPETGTAPI